MDRVYITLLDKCIPHCKIRASMYGYDSKVCYEECNDKKAECVLLVYSRDKLVWYEEFETCDEALQHLRLAVTARQEDGQTCSKLPPSAQELACYACENQLLIVRRYSRLESLK